MKGASSLSKNERVKYGSLKDEGKVQLSKASYKIPWVFVGPILLTLIIGCLCGLFLMRKSDKNEADWTSFNSYRTSFNKEYNESEVILRFQVFQQNVREIETLNFRSNGGAVFGLNEFSDLTKEEFADAFLNAVHNEATAAHAQASISLGEARNLQRESSSIDWRDKDIVTPVRDQGYCGSCWAFAAVQTIESAYIINEGVDDLENFALSYQEMVSCDDENWGCYGGDLPYAFEYVMNAGGISNGNDYPYTSGEDGSSGTCLETSPLSGTQPKAYKYATEPCYSYNCNYQDEESLAESLVEFGPIAVCVNAYWWQYYQSGIMSSSTCGYNGYWDLNHCVQLVGYAAGQYWILKNSWSTEWGEDGYIRLSVGDNTCGIADEAIYVELYPSSG